MSQSRHVTKNSTGSRIAREFVRENFHAAIKIKKMGFIFSHKHTNNLISQ